MERDIRLTRELVDQIVFGMENQDSDFHLDLEEQVVVPGPDVDADADAERYVPLPEWRPVDGYNLMERFVAELRNPIFRERLRSILASGRGVFRQFKNALRERPDIERLWFGFKQREMRALVGDWINDLREQWGLERLSLEDDSEETLSLIETDFTFTDGDERTVALVRSVDRDAFAESFPDDPEAVVGALYEFHRAGLPGPEDGDSALLACQTPAGETAAVLWSVLRHTGEVTLSVVVQLYVSPEYRGLGLARALLREHLLRCHAGGVQEILVTLPGAAAAMESSMEEPRMARASVTARISTDRWHREDQGV